MLTTLKTAKEMRTLIIYACLILPDGKFIILDYNKKQLLLFKNDGIFIRRVITFTQSPYDACFVRKNTVAVTLGPANQTTLVDIEKKTNIQTIKFSHYCFGVASDGETVVISSNSSQSTRVNLNDMSHTILKGVEGVGRISLLQRNIYGTIHLENKVCCYDSTGEPLWTFQHKDINSPGGITLDMNGFVYIVSSKNGSIVVVSPDGKTCKTILSEADGIKHPYGIDINKKTEMVIVSSIISEDIRNYDTAFVYKI
ncbi:unnamed protein product [Mytilus coruscus]|uniref:RING-type E3 ubiquitin transferase n=1 Tax=Mytilus coruscus TaxID=42192 RepID=A0A6J8CM61_MYTCO|nr:unnamed protein product [Mytilus coruscus]